MALCCRLCFAFLHLKGLGTLHLAGLVAEINLALVWFLAHVVSFSIDVVSL